MDDFWSDIGPQYDGTVGVPAVATAAQPADAGGGAPANYSQAILDVFRIGVQAWTQNNQAQAMVDYKKWEATGGGLAMNGVPVGVRQAVNSQGGGLVMLVALGVVGVVVWKLVK